MVIGFCYKCMKFKFNLIRVIQYTCLCGKEYPEHKSYCKGCIQVLSYNGAEIIS